MGKKGKQPDLKAQLARLRAAVPPDTARRLASIALATVLFVFGLFCLWQAHVIKGVNEAQAAVQGAQRMAAIHIGHTLSERRNAIAKALADPQLKADLARADAAGRALAGVRARSLLPHMLDIEFFDPSLDKVVSADYQQFGFAKAAQLLKVESDKAPPEVGVVRRKSDHVLTLAMPVSGAHGAVIAYAWLTWLPDRLAAALVQMSSYHGRLILRQGQGNDGPILASYGGRGVVPLAGSGQRVSGSNLWVTAEVPTAPVALPGDWPVAVVLAVLAFIGCAILLWIRFRPERVLVEAESDVEEEQAVNAKQPGAAMAAAEASAPAPAPQHVDVDRSIFRAYDIRGVVGEQLSVPVVHALGQAIGGVMREKDLTEIVVGRDGRLSGPELAGALSDGLRAAGIDVIDIGAVPTPVVYFATFHFSTGSGVAVTGSHNPPNYNGFKVMIGGDTLSEDAIADLYRRIDAGQLPAAGNGGYREADIVGDYIDRIASDVQVEHPLKVVVDAGNGIAGDVAPRLLEAVGCEVVPLFCEVDGQFPNHHPDPSNLENLEDIKQAVAATDADLGVAFDGDGDRLGVVTRSGEVIFPDRVLMLFARDVLARDPGATIIYDVKCTAHLGPEVLAAGGSPLMSRTGHSLIKAKMRETDAALAGEMSGHFFFRERWYGFDDGVYAAARLLEILAGDLEGRDPEAIFATLPKGVSTPEIKVEMAEGENHAFIERFQQQASFEGARLTTIDGVRADWPDGWGLVRASNTTPVLVLRFDADNEAALQRVEDVFREQLLAMQPDLEPGF